MKICKRILVFILALSAMLMLAACGGGEAAGSGASDGEEQTYSVDLHTQGGMALSGVEVYVYADDACTDLKQYGQTDENGQVSFALPEGEDYFITLTGFPEGYSAEQYYTFDGTAAEITLVSSLISGENLATASLSVGDVMYDFSVTTPDGQEVTLSEMLAEKEMVLINFWYSTCSYCVAEFPYMEQAYQQFSDSVGIIALNPYGEIMSGNDSESIAAFQESYGLSFTMAECPAGWTNAFNISGYPTSVIVDRYGVICMIHAGGLTSLNPFVSIFAHFTGEDYQQVIYSDINELVTQVKPTYTMPDSGEIAAVLNGCEMDVSYRPEADDEYSWPFIIGEKNGESCIYATNQEIESSYAILYADLYLEAGQAVGFDYLASSEKGCDILYVIVDGEAVYSISGVNDPEVWETCYPWVANEDGYYEVALCYLKDSSENEGDDTVYLRNLRVVSQEEIDVVSYIPQLAATSEDGKHFEYADIFYNEQDGYYHVGSENGPLLLANLMSYTQFNEEKTVWDLVYNGDVTLNGQNIYEDVVDYFSYASNSSLYGYCTVDAGLAELLQLVGDSVGFEDNEKEWLKICKYYQVYGPTEEQLTDPIKGLAGSCAFEAKLGVGVESNYFYYDRPIMPRGLLAAFTPTKSGVYRITSHSESENGVEGWIFTGGREEAYTYDWGERLQKDDMNVSMLYYMEAGETYYIDIAFWDIYEVGYIYYDVEYVAPEFELFRSASPGYFTTTEEMYYVIAGGIDVVLGSDGYYYEDLGTDANGNQRYGGKLYADFTNSTPIFSKPLASGTCYDENGEEIEIKGIIELGGFDFSKTENDLYILSFLKARDYDVEKTDEYLRELWGEDYDSLADSYQLEDVYAGRYHGTGEDLTEEIQGYLSKVITSGKEELIGCVPVDERLGELLQMLMDKYTFSGVEHSWTKVCYYYEYLGPEG